ncbi:head-tail connector protein [Amorphus sp. 3PC139-8]|uniref:head-tail connector protein n=1 Tax=Amorphus sp. 3PC139-8 TaxID=2735676 RepID=UPI00345D16AE
MTSILTEPPTLEPVTLAEAKQHLRVDTDAEDTLIADLIAAARRHVEATTGRALLAQGWRIVRETVPHSGIVRLEPQPVLSIDAVTVRASDGTASVLGAEDYVMDLVSSRLRLLPGGAGRWRADQVEIDITAGYGTVAGDVPAPLRQAVLMLVAHWHQHREAALVGPPDPVSLGVSSLVRPYRLARVA